MPGWLKQQIYFPSSKVWKLEVKVSAGLVPSESREGRTCSNFSPWLLGGCVVPVSIHHPPSVCDIAQIFSSYKDASHFSGIQTHSSDLILT